MDNKNKVLTLIRFPLFIIVILSKEKELRSTKKGKTFKLSGQKPKKAH